MPNVSKIEHSYSEVRRAKVTLFTKQRPDIREFHIGIDDTDSDIGGCTTYTAAVLFQELFSRGFKPSDFPISAAPNSVLTGVLSGSVIL